MIDNLNPANASDSDVLEIASKLRLCKGTDTSKSLIFLLCWVSQDLKRVDVLTKAKFLPHLMELAYSHEAASISTPALLLILALGLGKNDASKRKEETIHALTTLADASNVQLCSDVVECLPLIMKSNPESFPFTTSPSVTPILSSPSTTTTSSSYSTIASLVNQLMLILNHNNTSILTKHGILKFVVSLMCQEQKYRMKSPSSYASLYPIIRPVIQYAQMIRSDYNNDYMLVMDAHGLMGVATDVYVKEMEEWSSKEKGGGGKGGRGGGEEKSSNSKHKEREKKSPYNNKRKEGGTRERSISPEKDGGKLKEKERPKSPEKGLKIRSPKMERSYSQVDADGNIPVKILSGPFVDRYICDGNFITFNGSTEWITLYLDYSITQGIYYTEWKSIGLSGGYGITLGIVDSLEASERFTRMIKRQKSSVLSYYNFRAHLFIGTTEKFLNGSNFSASTDPLPIDDVDVKMGIEIDMIKQEAHFFFNKKQIPVTVTELPFSLHLGISGAYYFKYELLAFKKLKKSLVDPSIVCEVVPWN